MYILFGGGGNLIDNYNDCNSFLKNCIEHNIKKCIILPHTVRGHEETIGNLDKRFYIVCREYESYNWLNDRFNHINIMLANDLALSLDINWLKIKNNNPTFKLNILKIFISHPKKMVKYLLWKIKNRKVAR